MKCSNISSRTILILALLNILAGENVYEKKYMGKKFFEFDIWLDLLCVRPFICFFVCFSAFFFVCTLVILCMSVFHCFNRPLLFLRLHIGDIHTLASVYTVASVERGPILGCYFIAM